MFKDPAGNQLIKYKESSQGNIPLLTTGNGVRIANKTSSITVGPRGPILLQDNTLIDEMTHFNRERIPERVVHAKGAGAYGFFEVTHDITRYSKANIFSKIGKKTNIFVRFSTVAGELGSADTVRDPRGFAIKFYTEDGIWDLVGNNTPVFFIKDPLFFPSFIHTQKRNPVTHLKDADMFWDFATLRTEITHQLMILFSDRGIPDGYRHMNGYGSHTFKLVNCNNEVVYCKFHYKTDQGIKNLLDDKAAHLASTDPDYAIRDLYNAIECKNYPSWTFYIQVMTIAESETFKWNPFDITKIWPHADFPLIPVGTLVLNKNPDNYFNDVEQVAFNPAHMVPGIEPSPDKLLQGRLFGYGDAHRYRLGPNHLQLSVNCPFKMINQMINYQRDGLMTINNQGSGPNYYPNSFCGPEQYPAAHQSKFFLSGNADRFEPLNEDDFGQPSIFWRRVLNAEEKKRFVNNLVDHLKYASTFLIERAVCNFTHVDIELGQQLTNRLHQVGVRINFLGKLANL